MTTYCEKTYEVYEYPVSRRHKEEPKTKLYAWLKAIPLEAWTGPDGSRRLRPLDLKKIST
jgi:hypothetical protein